MSLFGDPSPTEAAPTNSKSLFGNEPAAASSTSLFDDDANASPWSMPTPKKQARQNLLKTLLPATDVPESYIDAFDIVVEHEGSGAVSYESVESILRSASLTSADQTRILGFVAPSGRDSFNPLGRSEFNVLLALIGLAQESEELSLDGVDERRRRTSSNPRTIPHSPRVGLPRPKISFIDQLQAKAKQQSQQQQPPPPQQQEQTSSAAAPKPSPSKQQKPRQDSFGGDPTVDPWGSPSNKRVPPPSTAAHTMQAPNGFGDTNSATHPNGVERTTSAFTTNSAQDSGSGGSPTAERQASSMGGGGWGSYNGGSGGFSEQPTLGGGFGDSGEDESREPGHRAQPSIGGSVMIPSGTGESVTVTLMPEKEGMFLFQHHNYEVKTIRRGSSVVRRYSDFVWLLDCLQKRYPFRRLPLLPPKRVQGK
jgi:sorting nexin-8